MRRVLWRQLGRGYSRWREDGRLEKRLRILSRMEDRPHHTGEFTREPTSLMH
jgi:hypothetical protein